MHSWASSFRKIEAQIGLFASEGLFSRSLSTKSTTSLLGSSRRCNNNDSSFLESFLRSVSYGVVVAGSSLGLYCCSSLCTGGDSFLSYADSGERRGEPEKKSTFLFKGIWFLHDHFSQLIWIQLLAMHLEKSKGRKGGVMNNKLNEMIDDYL